MDSLFTMQLFFFERVVGNLLCNFSFKTVSKASRALADHKARGGEREEETSWEGEKRRGMGEKRGGRAREGGGGEKREGRGEKRELRGGGEGKWGRRGGKG